MSDTDIHSRENWRPGRDQGMRCRVPQVRPSAASPSAISDPRPLGSGKPRPTQLQGPVSDGRELERETVLLDPIREGLLSRSQVLRLKTDVAAGHVPRWQ